MTTFENWERTLECVTESVSWNPQMMHYCIQRPNHQRSEYCVLNARVDWGKASPPSVGPRTGPPAILIKTSPIAERQTACQAHALRCDNAASGLFVNAWLSTPRCSQAAGDSGSLARCAPGVEDSRDSRKCTPLREWRSIARHGKAAKAGGERQSGFPQMYPAQWRNSTGHGKFINATCKIQFGQNENERKMRTAKRQRVNDNITKERLEN